MNMEPLDFILVMLSLCWIVMSAWLVWDTQYIDRCNQKAKEASYWLRNIYRNY